MATNSINLAPLFALGTNSFWPTLSRRQPIPAHLASSPNPVVGLGLVKACWALLCHVNGVAVQKSRFTPPCWEVWLTSTNGTGAHTLSGDPNRWYVPFPGYLVAVAGALDVLSAQFGGHPAYGQAEMAGFSQRWQDLLEALVRAVGTPPPYTEVQLSGAAHSVAVTEVMMAASDALYVALLARQGQGVLVDDTPAPGGLSPSQVDLAWLYAVAQPSAATQAPVHTQPAPIPAQPAPAPVQTAVSKTLLRAIQRGRTVLLVGPTGVGKTEAVKQAALAAGATLVKIEGHPGLDDKLLFGGVYPDGKGGFSYVEGPLTEAWRYAADGQRVVLQLDELARMDGLYHAILIGALDTLSGAEIAARPKLAQASTQLTFPVEPAARYRVLSLPNGTVLIAPAAKLSVVATTNLGSAYQQAASQLDPALVRRFALRLEVERLEEAARRTILERQGLPVPVAAALVALEEFSVNNTASQGGLLQEALNLGVLLDWGQEAQALAADGETWPHALCKAAEFTAIPFACPRLADGRLEPPAVNVLRAEIVKAASSL